MRGKKAKAARQAANRFFSDQTGIPQGLLGDNRTARYFYLAKPQLAQPGHPDPVGRIIKSMDPQLKAEAGMVITPLYATYTLTHHPFSLRRRYQTIKRLMKRAA